jgi:hypothetical protein
VFYVTRQVVVVVAFEREDRGCSCVMLALVIIIFKLTHITQEKPFFLIPIVTVVITHSAFL